LEDKFYEHVDPICKDVYKDVTSLGLFTGDPARTRTKWKILGFLVLSGFVAFSGLLAVSDVPGWGWLLVGGVVSGVIVLGFARSMPQRTSLGAQEQRKWEAFRNYLQDLTRYQDMATARETFDRYLPYAIAFGVERDWVRRFEQLELPAPIWYRPMWVPGTGTGAGPVVADVGGMPGGMPAGVPGGLGGLSLDNISDGLFSSLNSMSNVLTSKPSSSGSGSGAWGGGGGGFGGGFSGGGGGGGFRAG
ncbi:MAG TPA: hypothetical protein VFD74_09630, partial [Thermoleophilia bacterium]|nr:hypothetical protein [Thermoleophilia bacterium]